jgi:hypothetical protein
MSYQQVAPPAPPPPAPAAQPPIKPGKRWYWIGGILIAAGIITAVVLIAVWAIRTSDTVDKFARFTVPPEGTTQPLDFKKAGTYTIYYEWRSSFTDTNGTKQNINNTDHDAPTQLTITVTGPDGKTVPIASEDRDITFSFNDKVGRAVAKVVIPAPGTYTMKVTSNAPQPFAIAVGKGIIRTIIPYALIGGGALLLGLALGLTSIIVTAVKRGRRKRERRAAEQAALGGYGPGGYGAPPPPVPAYPGAPAPTSESTAPTWGAPPAAPPEPAPAPPPPTRPLPAPPPPSSPGETPPWGPPRA